MAGQRKRKSADENRPTQKNSFRDWQASNIEIKSITEFYYSGGNKNKIITRVAVRIFLTPIRPACC